MGETALTVKIAFDKDHETDFAAVFGDRKNADKNLTKEDVLLDWITGTAEELGEKIWRSLRRQRVLPVGGQRGEAVYYVTFEDLKSMPDGSPGPEGYEVDIPEIIVPSLRRAASLHAAQAKAMGALVDYQDLQGFCAGIAAEKVDEAATDLWKKKVGEDKADRRKDREEAAKATKKTEEKKP